MNINTKIWVDSAQVRYYWKAHVNATLILRVPYALELEWLQERFFCLGSGDLIVGFFSHWLNNVVPCPSTTV